MTKYQIAELLIPTDWPDVISEFNSFEHMIDRLEELKLKFPRSKFVWRKVD